jgi:hypothetical protein
MQFYRRIQYSHLFLSLVFMGGAAGLVHLLWYPDPYTVISSGNKLLAMIVGVDIVCGPVLVLLLISKSKTNCANSIDSALIFFIQISAFIYGIHVLSQARPIALVHEVDRYVVVSYADLDKAEFIPEWVKPMSSEVFRQVGIRPVKNKEEKQKRLTESLKGNEPSHQPELWMAWDGKPEELLKRSHALELIRKARPLDEEKIDRELKKIMSKAENHHVTEASDIRWMPLVSRGVSDWIVLLSPRDGKILGYVNTDGFVD